MINNLKKIKKVFENQKNKPLKETVKDIGKFQLGAAATAGTITGVVGTFGVAGTGTAISTLSGAALTNATLAAIGGSVAMGTVVLGSSAFIGGGLCLYGFKKIKQKYATTKNNN